MKSRKIIATGDNSQTLLIPDLDETYHSTHGALTESLHVFIKEGLQQIDKQEIRIFEMGWGTGLNSLLSFEEAISSDRHLIYIGAEKYPLSEEEFSALSYPEISDQEEIKEMYFKMHRSEPNQIHELHELFSFEKRIGDIASMNMENDFFDVIYFDAFGPRVQEDLWSEEIMQKMYDALRVGGILVTYCAQGQFRRNLKAAGFEVEKLEGPPGKREMTKATKRTNK